MLIKKIIIKSVVQTINFLNFKPILNQNNMKNLTTFTKKTNWLKTFNFFEHKTVNNKQLSDYRMFMSDNRMFIKNKLILNLNNMKNSKFFKQYLTFLMLSLICIKK